MMSLDSQCHPNPISSRKVVIPPSTTGVSTDETTRLVLEPRWNRIVSKFKRFHLLKQQPLQNLQHVSPLKAFDSSKKHHNNKCMNPNALTSNTPNTITTSYRSTKILSSTLKLQINSPQDIYTRNSLILTRLQNNSISSPTSKPTTIKITTALQKTQKLTIQSKVPSVDTTLKNRHLRTKHKLRNHNMNRSCHPDTHTLKRISTLEELCQSWNPTILALQMHFLAIQPKLSNKTKRRTSSNHIISQWSRCGTWTG